MRAWNVTEAHPCGSRRTILTSRFKQVSTKARYAALERAGIGDYRWRDLRHTCGSWHVQNGTPLFALQELGGWASTYMMRRYAHLAAVPLAPNAERRCALRTVEAEPNGTNTAHA